MFPWCKIKCIQLMITAVLSVFLRTNLQQMHLDFRSLLLVITSLLILNLNKTLANKLLTFYFNRVVTKVAKWVFFQSLMLKWDQRHLLVLQQVPTLMVLLLVRQSVSQVQDKQHQDQQNTVSLARLSGFSGGWGGGTRVQMKSVLKLQLVCWAGCSQQVLAQELFYSAQEKVLMWGIKHGLFVI